MKHPHSTPLALAALVAASTLTLSACAHRADSLYDTRPFLRYGERPDFTLPADPEDPGSTEILEGLDAMLPVLLERSPSVAAARERYRAMVESVPMATELPELMFEYSWLPMPHETRLGLMQAVPFPTKLVARDSAARAEARAAAIAYDAAVRDQIVSLSVAYADLYYAERALTIISENKSIAEAISQLGATRSAEGEGVLFDVTRARAQLAQLEYDKITISERRDVARAKVNAALSRPVDAPLAVEALPFTPVTIDEQELYDLALLHQQELAMLDESISAAESHVDLAASGWLPNLTFGAQLMIQAPPAPAQSNESVMVTFGLGIPVSLHATAAAQASAEARLSAAVLDKQAALDALPAHVREALFQERNAARLEVLYDEELLPRAKAAMQTAEQQAQADSMAYGDLLEARAAYYSFALARERALADHFQSVLRLESLIGATLTDSLPAPSDAPLETPTQDTL